MQLFLVGNVSGVTGTSIQMVGIGSSILLALFSEQGRLKTIVISLYSLLIVGFITDLFSLLFPICNIIFYIKLPEVAICTLNLSRELSY